MTISKEKQVINILLREVEISRNFCAREMFLLRLAPIINKLNDNGWNIKGEYVKTSRGRDYVYKLVGKQPLELKSFYVGGVKVAEKVVKV